MTTTALYRPRHAGWRWGGSLGLPPHPVGECEGCDEVMGDDTYVGKHMIFDPRCPG